MQLTQTQISFVERQGLVIVQDQLGVKVLLPALLRDRPKQMAPKLPRWVFDAIGSGFATFDIAPSITNLNFEMASISEEFYWAGWYQGIEDLLFGDAIGITNNLASIEAGRRGGYGKTVSEILFGSSEDPWDSLTGAAISAQGWFLDGVDGQDVWLPMFQYLLSCYTPATLLPQTFSALNI